MFFLDPTKTGFWTVSGSCIMFRIIRLEVRQAFFRETRFFKCPLH